MGGTEAGKMEERKEGGKGGRKEGREEGREEGRKGKKKTWSSQQAGLEGKETEGRQRN